jgi:hypothetical protein
MTHISLIFISLLMVIVLVQQGVQFALASGLDKGVAKHKGKKFAVPRAACVQVDGTAYSPVRANQLSARLSKS